MNIETPRSVTYITGEQGKGYEQINKFFNKILKEKIKLPVNHPYIEKKVKFLWGDETDGCPLPQGAYSDEMVHMLLLRQAVIASVIETRTPNNYVHFDFFYNQKTLETKINEMRELEEERKKLE